MMKLGIKTGFITSSILISGFLLSQSAFAETLPNDVQRLMRQRESAIEKIDSKYLDALEELKLKYTKSGELEVANSINHMISLLKPESEASGMSAIERGVIGKWEFEHKGKKRAFEFKTGSEFTGEFLTNGIQFSGEWTVEDKTIELWVDGKKFPQHLTIVSNDALIFIGPAGAVPVSRK